MGLAAEIKHYKIHFFTEQLKKDIGAWAFDKLVRAGGYGRTVMQRSMRPARRMKPSELTGYMKADYDLSRSFLMAKLRSRNAGSTRVRSRMVTKMMKGWMPYKSSLPGEPPKTRIGTLRKLTIFHYDFDSKSVIVGPRVKGGPLTGVPKVLNEGGATSFKGLGRGKRRRKSTIAARPYVTPAFKKTVDHFPQTIRS